MQLHLIRRKRESKIKMKTSNLILSSVFAVTLTFLTSCNSPSEKVVKAEEKVTDANENLVKADEQYVQDMNNYKKDAEEKLAANEKSTAEFNARIENKKEVAKKEYQEKIAKLEQRNTDMKKRLEDYQAGGKENWKSFKNEFSHDMNELGQAFRDLMKKNVKTSSSNEI